MNNTSAERERKIEFIYGTMTGFCSVMRNLQEDYRTYAKNYSEEALELLSKSSDFIESAETVRTLDSLQEIDDEGIDELMKLSEKISELYQLRPQTVRRQERDEELSSDSWKVYLNGENEIAKVEYGKDRTKVQIIRADGNASEVIDIGTEEYRKAGGFAKRLLKASGLEITEGADLKLQEKLLDDGLFYINWEEGWIKKEDYFRRMTAEDFLGIQDYKDVSVNAVYEDEREKLTFYYTVNGKTEKLFEMNASNRQKHREFPSSSGKGTDPVLADRTNPTAYIPGKFPRGNWKITSFEEWNDTEYGPYKIRTDAYRYVEAWEYTENEGWVKSLNDKGKIKTIYDSGLLIHGGGWSESDLDNKKGSNRYTDTTLGCIRIGNLDAYMIVEILQAYLNQQNYISLEIK